MVLSRAVDYARPEGRQKRPSEHAGTTYGTLELGQGPLLRVIGERYKTSNVQDSTYFLHTSA
jgi:hypothetical protein